MLCGASPLPQYPSQTVYSGLSIPGLEMNRLVYFGVSVFWRASAATFKNSGQRDVLVSLARYKEDFRKFLLGLSAFPEHAAIWIAVSNTPSPAPVMNFPSSQKVESYHQHCFEIPGVSFILFVGKRLTERIRELCAARSPERIIFFTDIDSQIRADHRRQFFESPPTEKLRQLVASAVAKEKA